MGVILDSIIEFIRDLLTGCILTNLETMFGDVNDRTAAITAEVALGPAAWNGDIFNLIGNLSTSVILPVAGAVVSFVLCGELISLVVDRNNFHDLDSGFLFRFLFKACIAVVCLSHTTDIVMGIFEVGHYIVDKAGGVIRTDTGINVGTVVQAMFSAQLSTMELGELCQLCLETFLVSIAMKIIAVLVTVVLYMRMVEIYLYISVAPLPISTLISKEWGNVGTNYIKGVSALALQGFFIMVIVGIYSVLVSTITVAANLHTALWSVLGYTLLLCLSLFHTSSISRSVLHAH